VDALRKSLAFELRLCESAWNKDPVLEWAPWGGQLDWVELTRLPGFRKMEAHGQAPHAQH
jgi:hypothetical protein